MRKSLVRQLAAPIVCALFLIACGAGDEPRPERPVATTPEDPTGLAPPDDPPPPDQLAVGATVALRGCVELAPGTDQYVLRNIRVESRERLDPHRETTTPHGGITEGSWVRLDGADHAEELTRAAGQQVTVTGAITDTGQSAIGTAGTAGDPTIAGAPSQAAGDEHYSERVKGEAGRIARESLADGTAVLVRVTGVESTGERCPIELRPEPRR